MTRLISFTSRTGERVWCATWGQGQATLQTVVCQTMLEALELIQVSRTGVFPYPEEV